MNANCTGLIHCRPGIAVLMAGILLSPATKAACDEQSLVGTWSLQGNGQSLQQGETCVGMAELEFSAGGNAQFRDIYVKCQQNPGLPEGTQLSGRYSIRSGCQGEMDVGGEAWFVVVNGGQELLLMRGQGNITMSWTGSRQDAPQAVDEGAGP